MRWETGFPAKDFSFSTLNPVSGINWGVTTALKSSPIQAGVNFTYLDLGHKDWRAPFNADGIILADAEYCSVSSSFAAEFLMRYEKSYGKRIINYAEAGIGLAWLTSDHSVYQDNPDDKSEQITLHQSVLSRDLAHSVSGGVGMLIKLARFHTHCNLCRESNWTDLYLDLYGGGRKTNGSYVKYEGEGLSRTEAFNHFFFRVGINIKFAVERKGNKLNVSSAVPALP